MIPGRIECHRVSVTDVNNEVGYQWNEAQRILKGGGGGGVGISRSGVQSEVQNLATAHNDTHHEQGRIYDELSETATLREDLPDNKFLASASQKSGKSVAQMYADALTNRRNEYSRAEEAVRSTNAALPRRLQANH